MRRAALAFCAVVGCSRSRRWALDEHYELTAFVVQRGAGAAAQTIVVELLDRGADRGEERWTVSAYDDLTENGSDLITGPTARSAIARIPWAGL